MRHVRRQLGYSERRVCKALSVPRSTVRYEARVGEFAKRLLSRMLELVRAHPRFGYRRIWALLRREGWGVNLKRVHRLWKLEGLRVPKKARKRRWIGSSVNACDRHRATHRGHVWALDFAFDVTERGQQLKFLAITDEYTRECHALEVDKSMRAVHVQDVLEALFDRHGVPKHIRCDNGPELLARQLQAWLARQCVRPLYIAPGAPWENGYAESFIGRLKDELIHRELFTSLLEAQVVAEDWRVDYNESRPHGALGYMTPTEFAATGKQAASAPLQQPACQWLGSGALT